MKSIWKDSRTPEQVNELCRGSIHDALGINIDAISADTVEGTMPVDERTIQPFQILHGGASAVLAESLASIASMLVAGEGYIPLGLSQTIHHLRPGRFGTKVKGVAKALRLGKSHFVWEVELADEQGEPISVAIITVVVKKIQA